MNKLDKYIRIEEVISNVILSFATFVVVLVMSQDVGISLLVSFTLVIILTLIDLVKR